MSDHSQALPSLKRLKQKAKEIKKDKGIQHSDALDLVAQEYGYITWLELKDVLDKQVILASPTPQPSLNFVEDGDIPMSDSDYDTYDKERSKDLDTNTKLLIEKNKRQLARIGVEFSIFEPTLTGFKKSILDATHPVRVHFELEEYHFYWDQQQGPDHKVVKIGTLLTAQEKISTKVSLYRPKTKKGDPRMWFKSLNKMATSGDQVAVIINNGHINLINISTNDIEKIISEDSCYISKFLSIFIECHSLISNELLSKLKTIAKKPFEGQRSGDTDIGYTLESLLGIEANSSKKPDYKGIEIKSGRSNKTRTTLFAQVADWNLSPSKGSAEILNKYGYVRGEDTKLYCTITTKRENSQGLSFIYDTNKDELQEWFKKSDLVAVWPGALLRQRLKEKHAETFWVEAKNIKKNGTEVFQLTKVTHTRSPILSQLIPLLETGVVTMDHLIKRSGTTNRVSEKGPLFKINKRDLDLLFPAPKTYSLLSPSLQINEHSIESEPI
jgi:hypothetical protein